MIQQTAFRRSMVYMVVLTLLVAALATAPSRPAAAQDVGGGRIQYGESVEGSLSVEVPREEWVFRGGVGEIVSIRLQPHNDFELSSVVTDEYGLKLADYGWDRSSQSWVINELPLPASGAYIVAVVPRYRNNIGSYTVSVELVSNSGSDLEPVEAAGPMAYNTVTAGHVFEDEQYYDEWTFAGQRGDIVSVKGEGITGFEFTVYLIDIDDVFVAWSQWDRERRAYVIDEFPLPTTGEYRIRVDSRYDAAGYYKLTLDLNEQQGDDGIRASTGGTLAFGQLALGRIAEEAPVNNWTFAGEKGDLVTIEVKNVTYFGTPGLWLTEVPDSDEVLAEGEYVPNTDNREVQIWKYELLASGEYTVKIGFWWGTDQSGYYELLVVKEGFIPTITDGGPISGGDTLGGEFSAANADDEWTFQADAGQTVTILMKRLTGNLICDFETLDGQGKSLAYSDPSANRIDAELVEFPVPASGTYSIIARPFARNQAGVYSLSLIIN